MDIDSFKPLELEDKHEIDPIIWSHGPKASELTFTNLFMWRKSNKPLWRVWNDNLLVILRPEDEDSYGLVPMGNGNLSEALDVLMTVLGQICKEPGIAPKICRAEESFVEKWMDKDKYSLEEDRDNSDYVYRSKDLIKLSGNKLHGKKNHLNKFTKNFEYEYKDLSPELIESFLELQEEWCELKDCATNPGLRKEDTAIYEALVNYKDLGFIGGAILIDSKVEAYTFGEPLNPNMAVIHVEKANPEIPGLYVAINNFFVSANWEDVEYVNREQDLGIKGIRKAKQSYNPDHMINKYTIRPK